MEIQPQMDGVLEQITELPLHNLSLCTTNILTLSSYITKDPRVNHILQYVFCKSLLILTSMLTYTMHNPLPPKILNIKKDMKFRT